jgi:hypothetical protein
MQCMVGEKNVIPDYCCLLADYDIDVCIVVNCSWAVPLTGPVLDLSLRSRNPFLRQVIVVISPSWHLIILFGNQESYTCVFS